MFKDYLSQDKMKKLFKKLAVLILTSILINIFIIGNTALAATDEDAKKYIEGLGKCDVSSYPVVIKLYEPMELAGSGGDSQYKITKCYEHTLTNDPANKDIGKFTFNVTSADECNYPAAITGILYHCTEVQLLLSQSGTIVIYMYINTIYRWAATIVGLISVMVMIFSGIQIATSGGETEVLTNAKSRIIKSLSGLAVLFLSGLILYTINPTFFTIT